MKTFNAHGKTFYLYSVHKSRIFTPEGMLITEKKPDMTFTTTFFDPIFMPRPTKNPIKYTGSIKPTDESITGFTADFDYAKELLLFIPRLGGYVMPTKCAVQAEERLIDSTCITPHKIDALKSTFEDLDIVTHDMQIIIFEEIKEPEQSVAGETFTVDIAGMDELNKCIADPVYFYETYFTVQGEKAEPLTELQKQFLRTNFKPIK